MSKIKRVVNCILEGDAVDKAIDSGMFDDLISGGKQKDNLADAKNAVAKFLKDKHGLDGVVKGYRVEQVEGAPNDFKVTIQFVSGKTFEDWLSERIADELAKEFHWSGRSKCKFNPRKGDQMELICRGDQTW